MKVKGTRGGILLSLEPGEGTEAVIGALAAQGELLKGNVSLEISERTPFELIRAITELVEEAGGRLLDVRPQGGGRAPGAETVIIARTVRSGARIEATGSVVVLADVNSGAEIIANDDIIVLGTLRGVAHAGASGNESAIIWAERIMSPQLRIGGALARASGEESQATGPEVAHLKGGAILVRPWSSV